MESDEIINEMINSLGANHREYEIKHINGQWRIIEKDGIVDEPLSVWLEKIYFVR